MVSRLRREYHTGLSITNGLPYAAASQNDRLVNEPMALLLFFICNYFLGALLAAESNNPLETLRPKHPRLIALDSDLERVRRDIATDPVARKAYERDRKSVV